MAHSRRPSSIHLTAALTARFPILSPSATGYLVVPQHGRQPVVPRCFCTAVQGSSTFIRCTEEGTNCEPVLTLRFGSESCGMWKKQRMFWTPMVNSLRSVTHPNRVAWCPVEEVGLI